MNNWVAESSRLSLGAFLDGVTWGKKRVLVATEELSVLREDGEPEEERIFRGDKIILGAMVVRRLMGGNNFQVYKCLQKHPST